MRLLLASRNPNKLRELRRALPDWEIELLEAADEPAEDGQTFVENARIKATHGRRHAESGEWVAGEDSVASRRWCASCVAVGSGPTTPTTTASANRAVLGAGGGGSSASRTYSSRAKPPWTWVLRRLLRGAGYAAVRLPGLLTAPAEILVQRLMARTTNAYGRSEEQRAQVLADPADVEPLLRRSADLIIVMTEPTPLVADVLLSHVLATPA